eukprot:4473792-Alexandrium_andersonii.AAC.1
MGHRGLIVTHDSGVAILAGEQTMVVRLLDAEALGALRGGGRITLLESAKDKGAKKKKAARGYAYQVLGTLAVAGVVPIADLQTFAGHAGEH